MQSALGPRCLEITRITVPFIELWPRVLSRLSYQEESILSSYRSTYSKNRKVGGTVLHLKMHKRRLLKQHEVVREMLTPYSAAEFSSSTSFLLQTLQKAVLKALFFINYMFRHQIFNKHKTQGFVGDRPT